MTYISEQTKKQITDAFERSRQHKNTDDAKKKHFVEYIKDQALKSEPGDIYLDFYDRAVGREA